MAIVQVVVWENEWQVKDFVYHILGTDDGWDSPHDNWRDLTDDEEHERIVDGEYDYHARNAGFLDDDDEFECL